MSTCHIARMTDICTYIQYFMLLILNFIESYAELLLYSTRIYHPLPASFSPGAMLPQLMPTMASPRPALHSAMTLASL